LRKYPEDGLFLVRLNVGVHQPVEKDPFTISRVELRPTYRILHTRISFDVDTQEFRYQDRQSKAHSRANRGLIDLIEHIKVAHPDMCTKECQKSELPVYTFV